MLNSRIVRCVYIGSLVCLLFSCLCVSSALAYEDDIYCVDAPSGGQVCFAEASSPGGGASEGGSSDEGAAGSEESADAIDERCLPRVIAPTRKYVEVVSCVRDAPGPEGASGMSAAQAAQSVVSQLPLKPITIGMAPEVSPDWGYRRSYVNFPIWMWVENPDQHSWGPVSTSAQAGAFSITMTAEAERVVWDMGDGETVTCGLGTAFHASMGFTESPTCGHLYEKTSRKQPGGFYTVTATTHWQVTWSSSTGQAGVIEVTTETATSLEIRELRAVNVSPPSTPGK